MSISVFLTKNALFEYFWACILKKLLSYLKSASPNLSIRKISRKNKNAWFMYFWAGIWKQYCHIWNQHSRICPIATFRKKKTKMPKFWIKNALLGYFLSRILENYCHIWNQHLRICLTAKFCEETKMPKFKTKNVIFGYFWPRMPFFGILGQELKKAIARFEISTTEFI